MLIRQHPIGFSDPTGGSGHVRGSSVEPTGWAGAREAVLDARRRSTRSGCSWSGRRSRSPRRRPPSRSTGRRSCGSAGRQGGRAGGAGGVQAGRAGRQRDFELEAAKAEIARLSEAVQGAGGQADAGRGKRRLGLSGRVPRRVDAATKAGLLDLLDDAVEAGLDAAAASAGCWSSARSGRTGGWPAGPAASWPTGRRAAAPMHGLLAEEVAEILALFDEWGEIDRSHRKLAHRGSYLDRVWVSPSTVRRVLVRCRQALPAAAAAGPVGDAAVPGLGRVHARTRSGSTTRPTSPGPGWRC